MVSLDNVIEMAIKLEKEATSFVDMSRFYKHWAKTLEVDRMDLVGMVISRLIEEG